MTAGRWHVYDLAQGHEELRNAWSARLDDGAHVAMVMGIGFDPRMCLALEFFQDLETPLALHTISFDAPGDEVAAAMASDNEAYFASLVENNEPRHLAIGGSGVEQ